MKKYKRIFTIVIDSLGVGAMPDAADFGDTGTDTLGHISEYRDKFVIPNLQKLGLANLHQLKQVAPVDNPLGYYTYLYEASNGKDTMTGHWEMMGLHITKPFKTFTEHGFPKELIDELSKRTGHVIIGNKSASGIAILDELGEKEIATGHMIVYTSADSVLQICGNEDTFGLDELYRCCEIARELTMKDAWKVGRVIARPYVGRKKGEFKRTANRHDYALKPYGQTALNALKDAGYSVISVGKIYDIFDGEGLTESNRSKSSVHGMEQTIEIAKYEKRNPSSELMPYYGSHDTSVKIRNQIAWSSDIKAVVWTEIVTEKIKKQMELLNKINKNQETALLQSYIDDIQYDDSSNRGGHAAKVYFNAMFVREIVANGYITQKIYLFLRSFSSRMGECRGEFFAKKELL